VLSESTERVDRGAKFEEYRTLSTLEEYVLVDSRKRWAEAFRRNGGKWIAFAPATAGEFRLVSVGLTIDLDELYDLCSVQADP
jgi:Uma2 family endonuclease